jgi:RimJ/RimL family protein N-acetyltransferase
MILPAFQGRGYARPAVRMLLQRAHADGHWGVIDAFPGTANAASNAICRGAGFRMLGEVDIDYGGRRLRCNHWRLPAPA